MDDPAAENRDEFFSMVGYFGLKKLLGPNTDNIYVLNTTQLTTIDLSAFVTAATIKIIGNATLTNFNLNGLTTVYDSFNVTNNPSLSSISLPALNYCSKLDLSNNSLSTSTVNSILNKFLTVLPLLRKNIDLKGQTPPAPPTAQGIIDYQTLYNADNYTSVDCFLIVSTTVITSITATSASSGGNVNSGGSTGCFVNESGVCWSTSPNPTTALATSTTDYYDAIFSSSITGLTPGTTYYVRAYAKNYNGSTAYGNEVSFTTTIAESIVTTTIGTQNWTTKNLDVATYSDGTVIPEVTDPTAWANLTTGAWCYYNNDSATGTTYGKLYNWYAVAGIHDTDLNTPNKKLAPTGYHIPSDAEWTTLTTYLEGESVAGGKMKATVLWYSGEATNSSGFSGLPGGFRSSYGTSLSIGGTGYWWSSSEANTTGAWSRSLDYSDGGADRVSGGKRFGFSVRCLRD